MMKQSMLKVFSLSAIVALTASCEKDKFNTTEEEQTVTSDTELVNLVIPKDFYFETEKSIELTINDSDDGAIYTIYTYSDEVFYEEEITLETNIGDSEVFTPEVSDALNQEIAKGFVTNGKLSLKLSVPDYYTKLFLRRKVGTSFDAAIVAINGDDIVYNYTGSSSSGKSSKTAKNYSGKSSANNSIIATGADHYLYEINMDTGSMVQLPNKNTGLMRALAINTADSVLYANIMYSNKLHKYDLKTQTWSSITASTKNVYRMTYSTVDGILYSSFSNKIYTMDPITGASLTTHQLIGVGSQHYGNLVITSTGELLLNTHSGLYSLELDEYNRYQATLIMAPPSDINGFNVIAMDNSDPDKVWLCDVSKPANFYSVNWKTGAYEYVHGSESDEPINYVQRFYQITNYQNTGIIPADQDLDADGVPDLDDEFPLDATKASTQYYPGKSSTATIAFEDLWPYIGDYDFNDLAAKYQIKTFLNAESQVTSIELNIEPTANGASFINGLGFELEGVAPSKVASVTGNVLTQNYISTAANGVENNQDNAVIIAYDNNGNLVDQNITVTITFSTPLETSELGTAPFNPFMIVNENRATEIHLPNRAVTSLGSTVVEGGANKDIDGDFKSETGLPWAINVIGGFDAPTEKTPMNEAYNHFSEWATSGGSSKSDWYKDLSGYRNSTKIRVRN